MEDSIRVEEEQNLNRCLSRIDEITEEDKRWLETPKERASVHGEAARFWRQRKEQQIHNLQEVRPNPYFGRVDFVADDLPDTIQAYYFGKFHVPEYLSKTHPEKYIIGFGSNIFELFVNPLSGKYRAPIGEITGEVKLKRRLLIQESRLKEIIEYELPVKEKPAPVEDSFLTQELSKSKGEELPDIIATIKPEQYEEIAAALQQVIIIQGVAGSGKSEVGLHRIVYLLSPHTELNLGISPERVIFFGPSKPFLRYVFGLLPGLHVYKVKQTTIRDWILSTLSSRVRPELRDRLFEKQLKDTEGKLEDELKVSKLKVSLQMARILERHVKALRNEFTTNATDILRGREVIINAAKVRKIIQGSRSQPLNEQRKLILSRIHGEIQKRSLKMLDDSLRTDVESQFNQFWPELDYKETYIRLLSDKNALVTNAKGSITVEQAKHFTSSLSEKRAVCRSEDLPALCYLDHLLNDRENVRKKGRITPPFEHVVIDEAQDVSPLEFLLLYRHSKNKSFTILGDIGQVVLPHRGITSWRDLKQIFTKESIRRWDMRVSNRSTYEITKYANRILKKNAPGIPRPIPYQRYGGKPALIRSKSYADMVTTIAEDIRSLKSKGIQTIAVLCKTSSEASNLQRKLHKEGIQDAVLLDKSGYKRERIAVSSIYLTKGLEYDAVILANARKNNYSGSALHNRLLYIAVTRAAHVLHIHWFGTLADILVDPTLLPKTKRTKTKKSQKRAEKTRQGSQSTLR